MSLQVRKHEARQGNREAEIASALGLDGMILHEIDFEDVFLTEQAMETIGFMAGRILARHVTHPDEIPAMYAEIMEGFTEKAYWVEGDGQLVIAVSIAEDNHYIQVPARHWMFKGRGAN